MPTMRNGRAVRRGPPPRNRHSSGKPAGGQIVAVVLVVLALVVLLFGRKLGLPSDLLSLLFEPRPAKLTESDWRVLNPPDGMFLVEMPGEPAREEIVTGYDGRRIITRTWSAQVAADQVFLVQYADLREVLQGGDSARFLEEGRESAVRAMQGKLVNEKPVTLGPVPGREVLVQGAGRAMRARMYLKDGRLYSLQVVSPRGRVTSPVAERFFASFKFRSRADAGAPGWKEYANSDGRFSVLLPGAPEASEQKIPTRAGEVTLYEFTLRRAGANEKYSVLYMDYPDLLMQGKTAEQLLKDAGTVDAFNLNGTVLREQALSLDGHAGREVHVETAAAAMRIRLYLVDRRLYKTIAMWPRSRTFSPDDERFLASFRLSL